MKGTAWQQKYPQQSDAKHSDNNSDSELGIYSSGMAMNTCAAWGRKAASAAKTS